MTTNDVVLICTSYENGYQYYIPGACVCEFAFVIVISDRVFGIYVILRKQGKFYDVDCFK